MESVFSPYLIFTYTVIEDLYNKKTQASRYLYVVFQVKERGRRLINRDHYLRRDYCIMVIIFD
jgi:hypothetical protein